MKHTPRNSWRVALPAFATLTSLALPSANAVDITWIGLNANTGSTATDFNDGANWDSGTVPTTGDTAIINFIGGDGTNHGDLFITSSDADFNPSGLTLNSSVNPDSWRQSSDLYLDKSLVLTDGFVFSGYGSGGGSGQQQSRFQVGTQELGVSIDISSWTMNNNSPGWAWFMMGSGDGTPGSAAEFNFVGSTITFNSPNNDLSQQINGGTSAEDALLAVNPRWNFTAVGGTINLQQGANRTTGTIGLGQVHLNVRSDQTWNADPLAFITMRGSAGASGNSGKFIVGSIDGGRLDNLGALNLKVTGTDTGATLTTAMQFSGGTYGSFIMQDNNNSASRTQAVKMIDDIALVGNAVLFDESNQAYASDFGLVLHQTPASGTNGTTDPQQFYTQGNTLDITNGILFQDDSIATRLGRDLKIFAEDSTFNVGGDIVMTGDANKLPGGSDTNTNIGIEGGVNGTNLTLGGSWIVQTVSAQGSATNYNLSTSTFTMNGGSVTPVTFEVGDASTTTGVQAQTWSIATFNVGVNAGDTAHVQLINDYLNNNPFTTDANLDKVGEKLIVGTLNIRENSILDANLGFASVEVASLLLETGAILDLNTNISLSDGETVSNFIGLGDQTIVWSSFAGQVIDSDNVGTTFEAFYDSGNDQTLWQAVVPEPSAYALVAGLAGLAFCVARRRRR